MTAAASPPAEPGDLTEPSRAPSRSARAWALALLALGAAGAGIPSPLYPAYQAQLGFSDVTLTAIYAVYPLVSVPAVYLLGPLGDRLSPRRVMRCGIAVAAVGSIALALATSTGWLILGRVAYGIALAVITGAGVAVATSGADKVRAGLVSATVFILGTGLGPVLGGALTRLRPGSRCPALRRQPGAARRRVRRASQRARARALDRRRAPAADPTADPGLTRPVRRPSSSRP